MKRKILLLLPLLLLAGVLCRKPIYHLYRDVTFAWEERSPEAWEVKAFAESQGLSIGEYPWQIIELYETNPETREFVLNYPYRQELPVDLSGYDRQQIPLFLQWDPAWGYGDYGSGPLAVTGCGPTCLAMAGYYLTGAETMNPAAVAAFAEKNGYYAPGYGSSWTLISQGSEALGLKATELPLVKKKLTDASLAGKPIILALGAGDFTAAGHYVVLSDWNGETFRVNDPNSRIRSEKRWSYEELEPQIRNIWSLGLSH